MAKVYKKLAKTHIKIFFGKMAYRKSIKVLPKLEISKHMEVIRMRYFTDSEIDTMIDNIDRWVLENPEDIGKLLIKLMMHFMLATGCGANDLALLKWKDFTWEDEN